MSKTERQATVEALAADFGASPTLYVTDFTGLDVARLTELRRRLRAAGSRYVVVKNTLAQRALATHRISAFDAVLKGPVGMVLAGSDPLPAAKVLGDFAKEFNQQPAVKAGLVEGKLVDPAFVKRLGDLPPRDVLLGQLAGGLNGILYQVVGALEALREQRQSATAS
ncbi:MAG: 50S ribosomal protein L10 [Gemmatimonadales bacterium]|nr:50S ribosomal protein L10 [Gemmatimonadales bacterium]